MSEGEDAAGKESRHETQPTHVARAVALVLVGVALGVILLHSIGRTPAGSVAATSPTSTIPSTTPPPPPPSSTTAAPRPPAQVKALAANGTKVSGAAENVSATLRKAGYNVLAPANTTASAPSSAVYYAPGFVSEAGAVATVLGLAPTTVMPLPTPSPVADLRGANVLVIVGPDLTGQGGQGTPPSTAPPTTTTTRPGTSTTR